MEDTTALVKEEPRGIMEDGTPLFVFVGWLVVAYFGVYFVTFYAGPAMFGTRPYRPWYGYGRSMRRRRDTIREDIDDPQLLSKVSNYIEANMYD